MGSLNANGTRITTTNYIMRSTGSMFSFSKDRLELDSQINPLAPETMTPLLGTNANESTSQLTTVSLNTVEKITTPRRDTLVERIVNPDPVAASVYLGTNTDKTISQYETVRQSPVIKTTTPVNDALVERVSD